MPTLSTHGPMFGSGMERQVGRMDRLRVVLAEDHDEVRTIVVSLLRQAFDVVEAVGDGVELVEATLRLSPDVVVSDIVMSSRSGGSARRELMARGVDVPFVFITAMKTDWSGEVGPRLGYVYKGDMIDELIPAVRAVARGEWYLSTSFQPDS
jgi:DNA-binding NarL/FixJ family response regulator